MNQDSKRQVTLEDILRLKRAERPPAEFWEQFDRELRAKQLAALVNKRPWWRSAGAFFAGMRRYNLPLGASAILALSFVAVREYRIDNLPAPVGGAEPYAGAEIASVISPETSVENAVRVVSNASADDSGVALATASESALLPVAAESSPTVVAQESSGSRAEEEISPSARAIAANLAAAQAAVPAVTRSLMAPSRGFEGRALPVRVATVEPLQQMTTPAQVRSARLLSAMVAMSNDTSPRTERVASRLSGDQLYDVARRLSAKGDSFSVKF